MVSSSNWVGGRGRGSAGGLDRLADHEPDHVGPPGRVPAAGAEPDRVDAHRRHRPPRRRHRGQQRRAGRRAQLDLDRPAGRRRARPPRRSSSDRRGRHREQRRARVRAVPPPSATGRRAPRRPGPARRARPRRPRCRRSRRARPTSWKCTSSGVVPCTVASASASRANAVVRQRAHRRVELGGVEQRAHVGPGAGAAGRARRCARRAPAPQARARQRSRRRCVTGDAERGDGLGHARRTTRPARPGRRAACRRPRRPRRRSSATPVHGAVGPGRPASVARRGPAGHPGGEHPGAEPVVDVDHHDAGRAGVEHRRAARPARRTTRRSRRSSAPRPGARRSARRRRWAARPPCRPRRPGSRRRRGWPRAASSRWMPATPTSSTRSHPGAERARRRGGLRGHRGVGGAGGDHDDAAPRRRQRADHRRTGTGVDRPRRGTPSRTAWRAGSGSRVASAGRLGWAERSARSSSTVCVGGLAGAVDDLRVAGAQRPVGVEPGVAEVGEPVAERAAVERSGGQPVERAEAVTWPVATASSSAATSSRSTTATVAGRFDSPACPARGRPEAVGRAP